MVYKVYENVIGALEEMESRENQHLNQQSLPRSNIQYADQSTKNNFDVSALCWTLREFCILYF